MREIKFRAWNKGTKVMTYSVETSQEGFWAVMDGWGDDGIIQQFTGLKDKDGKEIYEGDVLRVESHGGVQIVEVKDNEGYAGFDFFKGEELFPLTDYTDMMGFDLNAEVIGNIYENPELVKEK